MKKVGLVVLIMLASISATFAQKIAVLDFKAGVGISQTDVDGLSSTFVTYFNPRGYQLVERSQINQVIKEQGFQQTSLTESQMVRLGQIMNLSKIVVGDVNIVGGSPNLDVRVIDVQSGEVTGRDGATFAWTNYRATMQQLAQKVASQIGVVYGGNGSNGSTQTTGKSPSGKVETILGYLQVYPEDLGSFNGEPTSVIAAVNRQKLNGYGDWRLPTSEELSLMATSKEKLGMGSISSYMSKENANSGGTKIVRLVRSEIAGYGSNSSFNQSNLPVDPKTEKITFRKVIKTIGSVDAVYNRIYIGFVNTYYDNPSTILQQNDGHIIKGQHQLQLDNGDPIKSTWPWITYYFTIEVREGRVRYTLTDFMQRTPLYYPCEEWMNKENPMYQHYLQQIVSFAEDWGYKFERSLATY